MRLTLSLILCMLAPVFMMAQVPVANFTQTVTSGCSPLGVTFTDQSTGSPKFWNWDFGNGQLSSSQVPPAVTFYPGTYTVTLVVRNSNGVNSITKTNLIVSDPSPNAGFIADKVLACIPGEIQFSDVSNANAGTINKWEWDFGDTTKDNTQNPKHTYKYPGYYGVDLKVTSTTGCSSEAFIGRYIRIVNGVKANFDYSGPITCQPPFDVSFKNLTSGPGNLTYAWDLGNGSTPTTVSPAGTYATAGTYTVKLKAQSDFGCSDSIQKNIPVNGNTTSFTAPANICLGSAATFQSTSSAPVKVLWNFGDGTSSNQLTVAKTYSSPGTYTVTLYTTFANCADSATKTIVVNDKPVVDFSSPKTNSCKAPLAVTFTNTSPDAVSSNWDFGDGQTGTGHPIATHTYTSTGSNTVSLTITDSKGCTNTGTKPTYVNIFAPNVQMANVPPGLCTNQSFFPQPNIGTVDPIVSYLWDFGDGATSTAMSPSHSYTIPANYNVKLTVTTADGCMVSSPVSVIQVGDHPNINFSVNTPSACRSDLFTFTNLTVPTPYAAVIWDFDDGTTSGSIANPLQHKFADTGLHSIKLTITSSGCVDSLTKTDFVRVLPPIADFDYKVDCITKTAVTFIDSSKIDATLTPVSYTWDFGGATPATSTSIPPVTVNYPPGSNSYNIKLVVVNGACTDSITKKIQLVNETASFTINKTSFCRNENVIFTSTNTAAYIKKYEWMIDGMLLPAGPAVYTTSFTATGPHTVQLVTTDINGCVTNSGAVKTFNVTGPTAAFTVTNNAGCSNKLVTFNDASISTGTITKWTYDFGDGVVKSFTAAPYTHIYADTGLYQVSLSVVDNIGCVDTFRLPAGLPVTRPRSLFSTDRILYCPGTPLQFTDSSTGKKLTYTWNFGDGTTDNTASPSHVYSSNLDSSYTVSLIVQDSIGCSDTLTRINYISIRSPKALYNVKDTITLCPPLETKFNFTGANIESLAWDFGDGTPTSSLDSTNHFYNNYGNYLAKLYVYGYGGCVDSASINIRVTNPYANTTVTFDPQTACNELTVNFNVTTPFGTGFQFQFGDGGFDTTQQMSFSHFYNLPNQYSPAILLYDSTGCQAYFGGFGTVDIRGAVPIFGIDKKKFCDSGTVSFTDYSQQARDPITSKILAFGDGNSINLVNDTVYTYTQPGLYVPTLTVTAGGCDRTFTDTVRVLATPTPIISSVASVCKDITIDLLGSLLIPPDTAIVWKWDFGNGQTSANPVVALSYPDTGLHRISLEATNSLGCKGDTAVNITVFPLPVITVTGDTSMIAGAGGFPVPLTYSANASIFNWTPATYLSCTNCANPFATPKFTTTYKVVVTDVNGCISSRNVTLLVLCNNKNFFIPNTFSPNNDGANDRFYPRGTGLDHIRALRIFNRWGELVFEKRNFPANDAASGWDGMFKGKIAATDTYVYMIDIICENATIITYKGNITLIR